MPEPEMRGISESIFTSDNLIIPMADVQHIEKVEYGLMIITCHTKWNYEHDCWENNIFIPDRLKEKFIEAWTYFRYEKDIKPTEIKEIV